MRRTCRISGGRKACYEQILIWFSHTLPTIFRTIFPSLIIRYRYLPLSTTQHILRLLNTNVKGTGKIMFALTEVKGVGRRYANLVCKKADVDMNKR